MKARSAEHLYLKVHRVRFPNSSYEVELTAEDEDRSWSGHIRPLSVRNERFPGNERGQTDVVGCDDVRIKYVCVGRHDNPYI